LVIVRRAPRPTYPSVTSWQSKATTTTTTHLRPTD
jgi:hypothetical protein